MGDRLLNQRGISVSPVVSECTTGRAGEAAVEAVDERNSIIGAFAHRRKKEVRHQDQKKASSSWTLCGTTPKQNGLALKKKVLFSQNSQQAQEWVLNPQLQHLLATLS